MFSFWFRTNPSSSLTKLVSVFYHFYSNIMPNQVFQTLFPNVYRCLFSISLISLTLLLSHRSSISSLKLISTIFILPQTIFIYTFQQSFSTSIFILVSSYNNTFFIHHGKIFDMIKDINKQLGKIAVKVHGRSKNCEWYKSISC